MILATTVQFETNELETITRGSDFYESFLWSVAPKGGWTVADEKVHPVRIVNRITNGGQRLNDEFGPPVTLENVVAVLNVLQLFLAHVAEKLEGVRAAPKLDTDDSTFDQNKASFIQLHQSNMYVIEQAICVLSAAETAITGLNYRAQLRDEPEDWRG